MSATELKRANNKIEMFSDSYLDGAKTKKKDVYVTQSRVI